MSVLKSPFYQVRFREGRQDFTDRVTGLTFEDCVEEDDLVKIEITAADVDFLDNPLLRAGEQILYQFGYIGQQVSPIRLARIANVEPSFGKTISLTLTATDMGLLLKKSVRDTVYNGMTASQVAERIAGYYGLVPKVEPTRRVYGHLAQGNRTDFGLLKHLAAQESGFRVFVRENYLYFTKRDLGAKAARSYTWGDGESGVISFRPSLKETSQKGAGSETKAVALDPNTLQTNTAKVNRDTPDSEPKLGENEASFSFDANAVQTGAIRQTAGQLAQQVTGKKLLTPATSPADLQAVAGREKHHQELSSLEGSLEIEGDPNVFADSVITIGGVGRKFSGNWYVSKVVHRITKSGGYRTSLELKKNATSHPAKKGAAKTPVTAAVNATTGPAGVASKTKLTPVRLFDANGNPTNP